HKLFDNQSFRSFRCPFCQFVNLPGDRGRSSAGRGQTTLSPSRTRFPEAHGQGEASQILTVPSEEALARRLPSGLKTTLLTGSVCPLKVSVSWPVAASQTFAV